jgi:hypothetical protein
VQVELMFPVGLIFSLRCRGMAAICEGDGRSRRIAAVASRGLGRLNWAMKRTYRGRRTQATSHEADGRHPPSPGRAVLNQQSQKGDSKFGPEMMSDFNPFSRQYRARRRGAIIQEMGIDSTAAVATIQGIKVMALSASGVAKTSVTPIPNMTAWTIK